MDFQTYLQSSKKIAESEKAVLDQLAKKQAMNPIEIRAAKSALQTLIENAIGKCKRILKHYDCPIVPKSGRDAASFLYETGILNDEMYQELSAAIGFRNAMIHDYMNFNEDILIDLVRSRRYDHLVDFLIWEPNVTRVQRKRIETFSL